MGRYWSPAVPHRTRAYARRPEVGWVIAVNRKPWIVLDVSEHDADSEYQYEIGLKPLDSNEHYGVRIRRNAWNVWNALPEHFAVCHSCGELAPCRDHERAIYAAEQSKVMERELKLLPGCCPACQEPISSRQETISFPGEYVFNPLAPSDPQFHTRRKCIGTAARYEEAWVKADQSRPRSLLTLSCKGNVIVHGDGDAECFGAVDSDCPNIHATHRSYSACYLQSHGCGRGCSRIGHPGTRIAGRPKGLRI